MGRASKRYSAELAAPARVRVANTATGIAATSHRRSVWAARALAGRAAKSGAAKGARGRSAPVSAQVILYKWGCHICVERRARSSPHQACRRQDQRRRHPGFPPRPLCHMKRAGSRHETHHMPWSRPDGRLRAPLHAEGVRVECRNVALSRPHRDFWSPEGALRLARSASFSAQRVTR